MKREIVFYGSYFLNFYSKQDAKTKQKIDFVLDLIRNIERVPIKFLKYLEGSDGIYEVKVRTSTKSIRIFCFFDSGSLVILINSFVKKTAKTPKKELKEATKLKEEYFVEKLKRKR